MDIRGRIELGFESWGRLVVRYRWPAIGLMLALALGLGSQLPGLILDNSVESFLHEDDPALVEFNEFRAQFGRDDLSIIAIEPPEVFDLAFLEKLKAIHEDLEREVPYLDEVTSLINARSTRGEEEELIVEDLLEKWPQNAAELAELERRVFANPFYVDSLISRDGRFTAITLKPNTYSSVETTSEALGGFEDGEASETVGPEYLTEAESAAVVRAIRAVIARYEGPELKLYLAGAAVLEERLIHAMQTDITRFMSISMLIIMVVLYTVFRRVSGVVLPLVTVVLSLVATFGSMVLLEIPLSLTTEIAPPFLLTVGICDSVHILVIVFQRLGQGARREDAIVDALGHSGLAVVMTSLTTAGGLLSFAWAEVRPISELGIVAPLGVMLAMVFSLVLLPALLAVIPLRAGMRARRPKNALLLRLLQAFAGFSSRRPWTVVGIAALVLALAGLGTTRLRFSNNELLWLPEQEPLRTATALIDKELRGVVTLEAVLETGEEKSLLDPELLRRLDALNQSNQSIRHHELFIGKTTSLVDVLKETHQALNENRPDFYAVPDDRQLIAQELLLFENSGSDDLEELVDSQLSKARISMKIPWADWMLYPEFLEKVEQHFAAAFGDDFDITLTGFSALLARAASTVNITMGRSYVLAFLIITPLMIFLLGSFRRGLLSMAPNLAPVLFILGLMGWLDVPLDMSTLLIGGIVIGLAVDDTIHFMHHFNRYYAVHGDPYQAVRETLETTGAAMLFTSVVLAAGFFVYTLAYTSNIAVFGLLAGVATIVAFLADVTLAPALMILVTRGRSVRLEALPSATLLERARASAPP